MKRNDIWNSKTRLTELRRSILPRFRKKMRSAILSAAACKATTEKLQNADFSERPKDKSRVLAVASSRASAPETRMQLKTKGCMKDIQNHQTESDFRFLLKLRKGTEA